MKGIIMGAGMVVLCGACAGDAFWDPSAGRDGGPGETTEETTGSGTTPDPTPVVECADVKASFEACADRDLWNEVRMDRLPGSQTYGMGPCYGCHQEGGIGVRLNRDSHITFDHFPFARLVTCTVDENGSVTGLEASDFLQKHGLLNDHPTYVLIPPVTEALSDFVFHTSECALAEL